MAVAVAIIMASITMSSCTSDNDLRIIQSGEASVIVATSDLTDNVAGVGIGGRVSLVGACLGIDTSTVIWPPGTKVVRDDPLTVEVPEFGDLVVGDRVDGGGKEYSEDTWPFAEELPSNCPATHLIAFAPDQ